MNPKHRETTEGGIEAASVAGSRIAHSSTEPEGGDRMKRTAAKQLIEQYYYQLTDGCGNKSCNNDACASCSSFIFKDIDRNKLAVHAIELFKKKATLCENQAKRFAKFPLQQSEQSSWGDGSLGTSAAASTSSANNSNNDTIASHSKDHTKIQFLTEDKVKDIIVKCNEEGSWSQLIRVIGAVFNNPESLSRSFLKTVDKSSKEVIRSTETEKEIDTEEEDQTKTRRPLQGRAISAVIIQNSDSGSTSSCEINDQLTIDLDSLRRTYSALMDIPDHPFQGALINALLSLSRTVEIDLKYRQAWERDSNYINIFIIVLEIPLLHSPEFIESAFPVFCRALGHVCIAGQAKLARIWSKFGMDRLRSLLQSLQQLITVKVINGEGRWGQTYQPNDDEGIAGATKVMKIVYYASIYGGEYDPPEVLADEKLIDASVSESMHELLQGAVGFEPKEPQEQKEDPLAKALGVCALNCRKPLVPYEEFINEPLNDNIDISTDYAHYRTDGKFSFIPNSFILMTASKYTSMYFDNRIRMLNERRTSLLQTIVHGGPAMPYLRVRVRRDHIIDDALVALEMVAMENPQDLKKQLFIEFDGEQGLDEGGVSKEFFELVVDELFNPDIGMFTYNSVTCQFWFNPTSFENDGQFTLIGIILGLAIYNSCILDIHFPMVVYYKLMGKKGTFRDLYDVDPMLTSSLNQILEYEGDDFEEVFMQTFRIGHCDVFGTFLTHDLKENGDKIPVTQDNKHEFVNLYADYLLNKSIERQFRAFHRGFMMVTNESPFKLLFRPEEIELLVCGCKSLDFEALEEATEYDGGFTASSSTVRNFWLVVHGFDDDNKRKLLQFTTGTDRVPVGGLSKLKLIIARNGPDSDRLPTSHTCFNVLLLPDYSCKDKLEERLLKAITYAKGFGML
ncbi:ubiquitin-protein ligase E3A-like [Gigantopelta aegis]|uniref:ubiquitin-protein ligase E3A-like n=1 Tax=Gigantopelta aegis TaxID=1735272 RepID=UPI001B88DFC3|nr:ubiquitin-protein ligase E3A-like [Gigantopelta aegis]